ncbi:hypothetical protein SAMN05428959_101411 [Duganella sp. CF517]|uniref:hypothetical protein n=1 Tax=Duganella sp. CF517 TaxID=1881038 RepID=UPI0008BBA896|nr:hypothetical protein [Duganella sp. CF517]SEN15062.1 hypothetical protein SAMN05428959_101411 [Duganella sp. CF517]
MTTESLVGIAALAIVVAGPAALGVTGWLKARRTSPHSGRASAWEWKSILASALLFVLAFNLTFFIQELALVLPKAFTPGLRPTLFHNNHRWDGDNALAALFQGTGALATLLAGIVCAMWLGRGAGKSTASRLLLFWMAYTGVFMALPQVVIGALSDQSDIGMAMGYFKLGAADKTIAALLALAAIPLAAFWIGRLLLTRVGNQEQIGDAVDRKRFVFRSATLPAMLALPIIVLFRVPREWIEVLLVPALVAAVGLAWIQAGAWYVGAQGTGNGVAVDSISRPLLAVLGLLLIFQLVLRPGIHFY